MDPNSSGDTLAQASYLQEIPEQQLPGYGHAEDPLAMAASALQDIRNSGSTYSHQNSSKIYDYPPLTARRIKVEENSFDSGVISFSNPAIEGHSNPLSVRRLKDEPALMQIDTSERESSSSDPAREEQRRRAWSWTHQQQQQHSQKLYNESISSGGSVRKMVPDDEAADSSSAPLNDQQPLDDSARRNSDIIENNTISKRGITDIEQSPPAGQHVAPRRWHSLHAESGGLASAVSEQGMRRLKYCMEWIEWATANLENHIKLLEAFIASIDATITGDPGSSSITVAPEALKGYMEVKRDVVNTIRKLVEVIGKYAGGVLSDSSKQKVKSFILSLPGRWSVAVKDAGLGEGWASADSESQSAATSPSASGVRSGAAANPRKRNRFESSLSQSSETVSAGSSSTNLASLNVAPGTRRQLLPPTSGAARHAAQRVLTLARESLLSVKSVGTVFGDTIENAETWSDRLKRTGFHEMRQAVEDSDYGSPISSVPPRFPASSRRGFPRSPSIPLSPAISSPRSTMERHRLARTPRDLYLEGLAQSIPSVGPYGPYGSGSTPPMSPVLGPTGAPSGASRQDVFPFHNPAPGAPGHRWAGGNRARGRSESGSTSAVPTLSLSDTGISSTRSRAGSLYESSTGESLPPPSVSGSASSVGGDDELDDIGNEDHDSLEQRRRKRRRKDEDAG